MSFVTQNHLVPATLLLGNHLIALAAVRENPSIRIRELSLLLDLTERSTQRVINDLEEAGLVRVSRNGRRNVYTIASQVDLDLPGGRRVPVERFLRALSD